MQEVWPAPTGFAVCRLSEAMHPDSRHLALSNARCPAMSFGKSHLLRAGGLATARDGGTGRKMFGISSGRPGLSTPLCLGIAHVLGPGQSSLPGRPLSPPPHGGRRGSLRGVSSSQDEDRPGSPDLPCRKCPRFLREHVRQEVPSVALVTWDLHFCHPGSTGSPQCHSRDLGLTLPVTMATS